MSGAEIQNNTDKNVIEVDFFSQNIADLVKHNFGYSHFFVLGEVKATYSEYEAKNPKSHLYFNIVGKESALRCAIWQSTLSKLDFIPYTGMQVIVDITISYYQKGGAITATVWQVYDYGEGKKKREKEKLIKELNSLGYFEKERKRKIPQNPAVVGIVTSATGAALRDIKENAYKRFPLIDFIVYNTLVQGENAAKEIKKAIELANLEKKAEVLIVGRGGGAKEDLEAFDTKEVANAIYFSKIPVISAVGHERDVSISDYVADVSASTPTDAAALITQITTVDFKNKLAEFNHTILTNLKNKVHQENAELRTCEAALERVSPLGKLTKLQQELLIFKNQAKLVLTALYSKKQATLALALQRCRNSLINTYNKNAEYLDELTAKLPNLHKTISAAQSQIADFKLKLPNIPEIIKNKEFQLKLFKEQLNNFDLNKKLEQGYALVFKDQQVVRSVKEVNGNDSLEIKLKDGNLKVVVTNIKGE